MDILYAEGTTSSSGVASLEFSFPESKKDRFIYPDDQNELLERLVKILFLQFSPVRKNVFLKTKKTVYGIVYGPYG